MYFDVDHTVTVATGPADDLLARAASEIERRRGSVLGGSAETLVFSARFWRVNGPLSFLVPQLPFGVSQGVLDVVERGADSAAVRCRVSFTWLRVLMAVLLLLLLNSAIAASARGFNWFWLVFLLGIVAAILIYGIALAGTRRFLNRESLLGCGSVAEVSDLAMTRFTLRSLFLIVTLTAAGLALVGNSLVEDRRQDRLVDEAIRAAEAEGSHLHSFGYEDGAVESGVFGDRLSEATVRRLIRAKRIQWVEIIDDRGASPMAQILAQEFIPDESDGVLGKWRRKGGERTPTKRLAWSRVNYRVIQGPNLWPGPLKK